MCAFCSCPTSVKGSFACAKKESSNRPHSLDPHSQVNVIWHWWNFTGVWTPPQGNDHSLSEDHWGEIGSDEAYLHSLSLFLQGKVPQSRGSRGNSSHQLLESPFSAFLYLAPSSLSLKHSCIMGEHLVKFPGTWIKRVHSQHQIRQHFQGDILKILWEHRQKH